jgi:hypothetical protein
LGIVATIGTNALHDLSRGPLAAVIAAWPAVALVISYELLMWVVKSGRELADSRRVHSSEPYPPQRPLERAEPSPALYNDEADIRETPEPLVRDKTQAVSEPVMLKTGPKLNASDVHVQPVDMSESDRIAVVLSFLADDPDLSGAEIGRRFGRDGESGAKWGVRLKNKALASMNGKVTH